MRSIYRLLLLISLLSSSVAYGQISEDPEERREQGQSPLKSQTPEGNPLPFKDRLRFGGGISALQFNPFSIGVSPVVAYQASEHLVLGIGVGYTYSNYKNYYGGNLNQYSGRAFAMYEIIPSILPNLYAHVELDQRSYSTTDGLTLNGRTTTGTATATWVGATYSQPIGRLFAANLSFLYNLNYAANADNYLLFGGQPYTIRISFF